MAGHDLLNNREPIDLYADEYTDFLKNLQGNIIKDHGRDFANHIFVTFHDTPPKAIKWIADFTTQSAFKVTSAWQQREDADAYKENRVKNKARRFVSFFLSAAGYRFLQIENKKPKEKPNYYGGHSFADGMRKSGETLLHDRPSSKWGDDNWKKMRSPNFAVHAMILLANDDKKRLENDTNQVLRKLKPVADSFVEPGAMMYQDGDTRKPREHFGYIDGISNPLFVKSDVHMADMASFAPLRLALVSDPGGVPQQPCFGSFLVFRKLEQDVKGFQGEIRKLGVRLLPKGDSSRQARAMALVMGRFPDGTPIAVERQEVTASSRHNSFTYLDKGGRCPIKAHVRRTNPRNDITDSQEHRIVRRGITYGKRKKYFGDSPRNNVGLLFMCYQGDIANQFEHIQKEWCNWEFGRDPIIGQQDPMRADTNEEQNRNREWPRRWASTRAELNEDLLDWPANKVLKGFDFGRYVTLQGGEYFFAPSISCFKNL